ncbi:MAG TPA: iron-containing alcohol dehydrogenase [Steroidobacteraceae bacterium]|nr:iron-containing alcohol dehydrogenase [Steroidobacteraceae bacterium]
MRQFMLTRLEKVISGAGSIERVGAELERRGVQRVLLVTSASLGRSRLLEPVRRALGSRCETVYERAAQHAPAGRVRELSALLERAASDAVVSFGGGSVIDSAKVAIASRLAGRDMTREGGALDFARAFTQARGPGFVHIAVPTTLSAGAFTPGGGVTDESTRVKHAVIDPRLQPCVVIHDPELCVETPDELWITTGIRVLDHAIEALYAKRAHPLSSALAVRAIRMIREHLPQSLGATPSQVAHRGECLDAAWLSLYGAFSTGLGLSHALGHQIGPAWDVPHGLTSCIALVPAMRFLAQVVPERFAEVAEGLGIEFDPARARAGALACADRVASFIAGFRVPTKLRELGIERSRLHDIAEAVRAELETFDALERMITVEEIRGLLDEAYG